MEYSQHEKITDQSKDTSDEHIEWLVNCFFVDYSFGSLNE